MRILHVIAAVADVYGGPPRVAREMCRALAARGHEVTLVTTDAALGERLDVPLGVDVATDGYTTFYAPCPIPRNPHVAPGLVWRVATLASRFDVAHVHGLFNFPASVSQLVLRRAGRPYLVRPCGLLNRYGLSQRSLQKRVSLALLERRNLERAAFIQASTAMERDDLLALGFRHVEVVAQGVEAEPHDDAARAGAPLDGPYVLFVGRVATVKGLPRLVRALAAMPRGDVRLVIAGPDEYGHRAEVERAARAAGVLERVRFTGLVSGAEKARYLAHAAAFALVSDSESFGVAAVEAAQHGLPLLVTSGVGLAEQVKAAGAGLVVEPEVGAIAAGLTRLLEERSVWAAGAARLAAEYTWERAAEKLEALYRRARSDP